MGVTLLAAMTTNLRTDLKDLDPTNQLWSDAELQRHLQHAVNDYQRALPRLLQLTFPVIPDSTGYTAWQVIANPLPSNYLYTLRVEYPINNDPRTFIPFREDPPNQGGLYFDVGDPPTAGDQMKCWYAGTHQLDNGISTIPTEHEEVIALGALAYAALAASRYSQNRLNASQWTPRGLQAFAIERLTAYQSQLDALRGDYGSEQMPMPRWGQFDSDWFKL